MPQDRSAMIPPPTGEGETLGPSPSAARVLAEFRSLIQEYGVLDGLSRRQAGLIRVGDSESLLRLLDERERVIARLDQHSRRLSPVRSRWGTFTESLSESERGELRAVMDELTEIAGRIAHRDDADRSALEQRRGEIAREMGGVANSKRAMSAYTQGTSGPNFQDRSA